MSYKKSMFEGVPKKNVQRSRFNLSHEWKAQFTEGRLVPCLTLETMPMDEFEIDSEFMFRFQSLYYPIMHKITMRADYYYVPNRILWTYQGADNQGWEKWIAEVTEEQHPYVNVNMGFDATGTNNNQTVGSYMGLPLLPDDGANPTYKFINQVNAFPFSAYLKIYDEYYSVRQLEDPRWFPLVPGNNTTLMDTGFSASSTGRYNTISGLWEKDYLTSALPTPQVGEAVQVPLVKEGVEGPSLIIKQADGTPLASETLRTDAAGQLQGGSGPLAAVDIQETASIMKQLRIAEVLQSYYERLMKIGTRYSDYIEGFFGKRPHAGYIDQPVLIGSKFGRVQISDTLTTAETVVGATAVQTGSYRGNANLYANEGDNIKYECREHGWIICLLHLCPNTGYGQGVERFWRRTVQADYPLDMFSSIGDQEILKEEVLFNYITNSKNQGTFGYIPRHSEMKYKNNMFVGVLSQGTNKSQHLGRLWTFDDSTYNTDIEIGVPFVHSITSANIGGIREVDVFRILPLATSGNSPAQHTTFAHVFHSIYVNRALPYYATPDLT